MPRRSPMKTTAVDKDEEEPRKIRSSRSKRRHSRRCSSTESESPPRKRSKKSGKRSADKKSKRGKVTSSSRRRRRSPSPSPSLSSSSSSSPSSVSSSSSSERSVSPLPPRSRSRDVKKRKGGRGRDRERRKARRSTSASSTSSSRGRSKSRKRSTKDGATRDIDRDEEEALVAAKKGSYEIESYEKDVSLEKIENPPSKNVTNETKDIFPAAGGSPGGEDLELILRQKALENFRKFRAAAAMAGKTDNGATPTRKELTDSSPPQNAGRKVTEARSAAVITPFRRQASSLGARHPTESPKSEDCGNGTSPWMQRTNSSGMTYGAGSPQQEGSLSEETHPTSGPRSPQEGRHSRSVMQRLSHTPWSASSVNRRLGSSIGLMSHVNAAPRIKSVVSIPAREELDSSTSSPQRPCENPAPVDESSVEVRYTPIDIGKAEGTNGDDRKSSEPSASNLSPAADGKRQVVSESRIEDKDGSQLQKKTFSRMHDGETVEVSYKVYIPKKTPALERRKLQR